MRHHFLLPLACVALAATLSTNASADETAPPAGGSGSAGFQMSATAGGSGATSSGSSSGDGVKKILPWVVGGLGAAQVITGVVLVVTAPDLPGNCSEDSRTCTRQPGQSDASFSDDQDAAGRSQQMPALGTVAIASGAVFLVAGAAMYFWYDHDKKERSAKTPIVTPYAGPNGGGLAAFASF